MLAFYSFIYHHFLVAGFWMTTSSPISNLSLLSRSIRVTSFSWHLCPAILISPLGSISLLMWIGFGKIDLGLLLRKLPWSWTCMLLLILKIVSFISLSVSLLDYWSALLSCLAPDSASPFDFARYATSSLHPLQGGCSVVVSGETVFLTLLSIFLGIILGLTLPFPS